MTKSLLGGGAAMAALFSISLFFQPQTSVAEPLASASQDQQEQQHKSVAPNPAASVVTVRAEDSPALDETGNPVASQKLNADSSERALSPEKADSSAFEATGSNPAQSFLATAYSLRGRTASGRFVAKGLIAADRKVLPLGTRVRIDAGSYTGEYLVADTGGMIRGRHIDVWMPSGSEAMRFGRRSVKLTVLAYGARRGAAAPRTRVRN